MAQHYFGHRIRDYRKTRGLSQSDLAARLGKSTSTISSYETDAKSIPVDSLIPLAEVFGITIDELIYGDNFEAVSVKNLSSNEKQIISNLIRVVLSKQIISEEEKLEVLVKVAHMLGLFFMINRLPPAFSGGNFSCYNTPRKTAPNRQRPRFCVILPLLYYRKIA